MDANDHDDINVTVGDECELRDLVIAYAACNAGILMKMREFRAMIRRGGYMSADFTAALARRLE